MGSTRHDADTRGSNSPWSAMLLRFKKAGLAGLTGLPGGGAAPEYMPKDRLIHLIKNAGRIPVERTSDYRVIREY